MNMVFDGIAVTDFDVEIDRSFCSGCEEPEANQDDTGLARVAFEIDGQPFEYMEWFSNITNRVETTSKMHPHASSYLAGVLDDYLNTQLEENDLGWDFITEINSHIEHILLVESFSESLASSEEIISAIIDLVGKRDTDILNTWQEPEGLEQAILNLAFSKTNQKTLIWGANTRHRYEAFGIVEFEGERYFLVQDAYIDGPMGDPHWEASGVDENGDDVIVYWEHLNYLDDEGETQEFDDWEQCADWDHPYEVTHL